MSRLLETLLNETHVDGNEDAVLETDHHDTIHKAWGDAIGASLVIQVTTLSGLIIVCAASGLEKLRRRFSVHPGLVSDAAWRCMVEIIIPSFAAGALLATAVFLIIPEAMELLSSGGSGASHSEEHNEETTLEDHGAEKSTHHSSGAAWKFGSALLGGFLFPILLGALFPSHHRRECAAALPPPPQHVDDDAGAEQTIVDGESHSPTQISETAPTDNDEVDDSVESQEPTKAEDRRNAATPPQPLRNMPLAIGILTGDIFHNLADGFFLGTAFLLCSKTLAWTIVATTIYHELAQEIADYFLLTHHCGLSMMQALTLNFAAGFSILIGVIAVFCADLGDEAIGAILSVSAGVYLYIAVGECLPRVHQARNTCKDTVLFVTCFVLGAVPIGLVLLNHVHCEE
jgi:zinc transporter ZupT